MIMRHNKSQRRSHHLLLGDRSVHFCIGVVGGGVLCGEQESLPAVRHAGVGGEAGGGKGRRAAHNNTENHQKL